MTPAECLTAHALWNAAWEVTKSLDEVEFNVPAHTLQEIEIARAMGRPPRINDIEAYAEEGMLQIALLNETVNPGSAFITQAYQAGWRYRGSRGFYRTFPAPQK